MVYQINSSELYRKIKFDLQNVNTPPRFIYAREPGSKAPYRFRIPLGHKKYEHRLLKGLNSLGLNPRIWSPKPFTPPAESFWSNLEYWLNEIYSLFTLNSEDR